MRAAPVSHQTIRRGARCITASSPGDPIRRWRLTDLVAEVGRALSRCIWGFPHFSFPSGGRFFPRSLDRRTHKANKDIKMMDSVHLIPERDRVIFQGSGGWDTATTLNVNSIIDPLSGEPLTISDMQRGRFGSEKFVTENRIAELCIFHFSGTRTPVHIRNRSVLICPKIRFYDVCDYAQKCF